MGETPLGYLICFPRVLASPLPLENWLSYPVLPISHIGKKRSKETKLLIEEAAESEAPWPHWSISPIIPPVEY